MTHISPTAAKQGASPHATAASFTALLGDRSRLHAALIDKRSLIDWLETAWVAAAETDAAVGRARTVRMDDRETWDRATWGRYLAAAAKHEPDYMPPIRRLMADIANFEILLALPSGKASRVA